MADTFAIDISNWIRKAGGNARKVTAKVMLDLTTAIVERTPVGDPLTWSQPAPAGYAGGRARGSWMYGFNAAPGVDPGTIDASGTAAIGRVVAGVGDEAEPGLHYITSVVPYMRRLEYDGWSQQAPAGMVRITIQEFKEFVARAAREVNQ